jgi:thiamine-phosphate pyrophosphorylase
MNTDYTPAVIVALERAQSWAQHLGDAPVEPVHLLLGLLHEEEGKPALLLTSRGLSLKAVRQALTAGATLPAELAKVELPLSSATEEVLRHARDLGHLLSAERTVASDQVLLAVLREAGALRRTLEELGLDVAQLEEEIIAPQAPVQLDEPLDLRPPSEEVDTGRILDASANRAREGLRVLEDYCRFALDDVFLTRELKQLRHDLAGILTRLPAELLLAARDTLGDVGTSLTTAQEQDRSSLDAVAQANLKRLQEALRSLEEYGKVVNPELGRAFEELRYRTYTLERALLLGRRARQRLAEARLYVLVSEAGCKTSLSGTIHEAAAGGAQIIQLREKGLDDRTLLERARQVRAWTRKLGVLFIMNDRPDLAVLADADGVHLGQEDMPLQDARRIVGADALIGVSTHNLQQVRRAVLEGASYIGIGPTFASATKVFTDFPGLDFIHEATAETSLPAFALGGITLQNMADVATAGAKRVAVSFALCQADDPRKAAAEMRRILAG